MMRGIGVLLAVLGACSPTAPTPPANIPAVAPAVSLRVHVAYRPAADTFEILDNVSMWRDGKYVQYRDAWRERFGITPEDEMNFAAYAEIRRRYDHKKVLDDHGLFAPRKTPDRVAHAFYASETLAEAFQTLTRFMVDEDVDRLRRFFSTYQAPCEELLQESTAFEPAALQQQVNRAEEFFARVAASYGVRDAPPFTVLYVWWPAIEHTTASARDHVLLLQYNPIHHQQSAREAIGVLVHELMHHLSTNQPATQKRALTDVFESGCDVDVDQVGPAAILEEPLAVAHQKLFESSRGPVDFERPWYGGDPWIGPLAKAIYESVRAKHEQGQPMDAQLMREAASACHDLVARGLP